VQLEVAIVPAFHYAYLEAMVKVFSDCTTRAVNKFDAALLEAEKRQLDYVEADVEQEYSSLALDVIGLSVFNYDFECVDKMSPVIQVGFSSWRSYSTRIIHIIIFNVVLASSLERVHD
jgi:hypothetical protein